MERNTEGLLMKEQSHPKAFFAEIASKSPEKFKNLRAFFDRAGHFANFSAKELAEGAVDAFQEQNLRRHAISWEDERTIRVVSKLKSEERDANLEFTALGALSLGNDTIGDVIQAATRARKLLVPGAQRLFWCVMEDLWETISPKNPAFDVEKALRYALQNFGKEFASKVLVRAYQGIEAELHAAAWTTIRQDYYNTFRDVLRVLCPKHPTRPWDLYVKEQGFMPAAKSLRLYAQDLQERLRLESGQIPESSKGRINLIIQQTSMLLDNIATEGQKALHQVGFQNHEQMIDSNVLIRTNVNYGVNKLTPFVWQRR
jgi:hypothetical protein